MELRSGGHVPIEIPRLGPPPRVSKDLGEFIDPLGLLTRQWIIAGLDTDASLAWLLARSGEHGWHLAGSQRLRKAGVVLEVRATAYLPGIGFDNMHNLRMTRSMPQADVEVVRAHGFERPHGRRARREICSLRA
jgi:hypothetical protein